MHYANALGEIIQEHWGKIWRNPASYGIGQIYAERRDMVFRAIDNNQLVVEEDLSANYLQDEKTEQARTIKSTEKAKAGYSRALAGTALAYQQANSAFRAPPATSMIVANPYWTPSNDASYVAMRAPNGVYY